MASHRYYTKEQILEKMREAKEVEHDPFLWAFWNSRLTQIRERLEKAKQKRMTKRGGDK